MDKHKIDIIFLIIIIMLLLVAFFGTFMSNQKLANDNIILANHYFVNEKELISICNIDYNQYLLDKRLAYQNELVDLFDGQDYGGTRTKFDFNLV